MPSKILCLNTQHPFLIVLFVYISATLLTVVSYLVLGWLTTYNKPIESNNYIVEGWQPIGFLEEMVKHIDLSAIDTFYIIGMDMSIFQNHTEGKKIPIQSEKIALYGEGIAAFDLPINILDKDNQITLKLKGRASFKVYPHFILKVNQQKIASGFVTQYDSSYSYQFSKPVSDSILTISVEFTNDNTDSLGNDRNLYISDVKINNTPIGLLATNSYCINTPGSNLRIYTSISQNLKQYLADLGVDHNKIKLIPLAYTSQNKTKAIAEGAAKYFSSTTIENLNIITNDGHSRRSYINFRNCLTETHIELGCISVYVKGGDNSLKERIFQELNQRFSLAGTWVYWFWKRYFEWMIPEKFLNDGLSFLKTSIKKIVKSLS